MSKIKGIDIGASFDKLMHAMRNPASTLVIQKKLMELKGGTFLHIVIRNAAAKDVQGAMKLIMDGYNDNPRMLTEIVGREILDLIFDEKKTFPEDDPNDIPANLFSSYSILHNPSNLYP